MRILGIESSSLVASVAIVEDDITRAEFTADFKKTHSQTLLPRIDDMVKLLGIELSTVDAIAVSGGPGSFTGLRIGSATAKGLGLALDKPLIHVPTLDATAYNLYGAGALICPIMDARRNQVYTGVYRFREEFEILREQDAMDMGELLEVLNGLGEPVIFLGDGVPVFKGQITAMWRQSGSWRLPVFRIHGQKGSSWRRSSVPMMNPGSSLEAGERSAVI